MKTFITSLFVLFFVTVYSQETFEKLYLTEGSYNTVTYDQNEGYFSLGDFESDNYWSNKYFSSVLDSQGNVISRKEFEIPIRGVVTKVNAMDLLSDSLNNYYGFVYAMYSYDSAGFVSDWNRVIKFNALGDTLWSLKIPELSFYLSGVCKSYEGGVLVATYPWPVPNFNYENYKFTLNNISENGDTIWTRNYFNDSISQIRLKGIEKFNDGYIITAAMRTNSNQSFPGLIRIDQNGELVSLEYFSIDDNSNNSDFHFDGIVQNNNFYVVGTKMENNHSYLHLAKIDIAQDTCTWYKEFYSADTNHFSKKLFLQGDQLIVVGDIQHHFVGFEYDNDIFIDYFDTANGDKISEYIYGDYNITEQLHAAISDGNNIFITGSKKSKSNDYNSPYDWGKYLLKVGNDGCVEQSLIECSYAKTPCENSSIELYVNNRGTNYLWNQGQTTNSVTVNNSGTYSCTFIDPNGCTTQSAPLTIYPFPDFNIQLSPQPDLCSGHIAILAPSVSYPKYLWNTGDTTMSITIDTTGIYSLTVNNHGCTASNSLEVNFHYPYPDETICLVTSDNETGLNKIFIEPTSEVGSDSLFIYRQSNINSEFVKVGAISVFSAGEYLDNQSNPLQQSYRYKISVYDTCGNESLLSATHRTILLQANSGMNSEVNLFWNSYEGFEYPNFEIHRKTGSGEFFLIATVPNNTYTFTDHSVPSGEVEYQVRVIKSTPCSPDRNENQYASSNIINTNELGFAEQMKYQVSVYPVPATDYLAVSVENISEKSITLELINSHGTKVYENIYLPVSNQFSTKIPLNNYTRGIYLLRLSTSNGIYTTKVILGE